MGVAAVKREQEQGIAVENDLATIKSDIKYINIGVADIKTDLRAVDPKIERLHEKLDNLKDTLGEKIGAVDDTLNDKVGEFKDALYQNTNDVRESLTRKLDEVRDVLTAKIDDVKGSVAAADLRMERSFAEVKASIASAKLWALGLYIALAAALLGILGRGFGWI